ncbi:MAG: imidazole glycerol phosphate synthase subunit HisH [Gammaproteobacteria bacterium]|nr:imidazole glycerol phosphate synthase subunit HisH [Gammaproteobacteria bacterium]MDH3506068.1 imidazole glycerol phosphate synthase subunit HisH [Gammaproteobacteria bacterium]
MSASPVIIASGGANLASLCFALERLGCNAPVTEDAAVIRAASHVLLPGVGAARDAMQRLEAADLVTIIPQLTQPVLGICLGMQLLFTASDEDDATCLDVIPGRARRFAGGPQLPVPQMGWNELQLRAPSALLNGVADGAYAYFIHSYALPVDSYTCAVTEYGIPFSSVVQRDNFFGTQFHPERSAKVGERILANFLTL